MSIVVCMTSWVKRINNVKPVVENVMKGTLQPDRLYLSLSVSEFPNKELDIPKDLVEYFESDDRLIINWVEGENTKTMKKVFPVLQYLEDDDIIIPMDDDIMYPLEYIDKRVSEYNIHFQPISGLTFENLKKHYMYKNYKIFCNLGGGCLFTKKMLNHWEEYVDDKILKSNNDDTCYAMLEWLNGYIPYTCKYNIYDDNTQIYSKYIYNEIEPSGELQRYYNGYELVKLHYLRIYEITGKDYRRSFNFFNIQKHDNI